MLGIIFGFLSQYIHSTPDPLLIGEEYKITGEIIRTYKEYDDYQRIDIKVGDRKIALDTTGGFVVGDTITGTITTIESYNYDNFSSLSRSDLDFTKYITDRARLEEYTVYPPSGGLKLLRQNIINTVTSRMENLSPDNRSIVGRLLIGKNYPADQDILDGFSTLGLSHLLVVSGLHIGILVYLIDQILKRFWVSFNIRTALVLAVILVYGYILGFGPSILRVLFMYVVAKVAQGLKIKAEPIDVVLASLLLSLLVDPRSLLSIGLLLSYGSVIGLVYFITEDKDPVQKAISSYIVVCSMILPIILYNFGSYNVISIVANVLIAPVFVLLVPLSMVMALIDVGILYSVVDLLVDWIRFYVGVFIKYGIDLRVPGISITAIYLYYMGLFFGRDLCLKNWIYDHRSSIFTILMTMMVFVPFIVGDPLYIGFIDVGQGDSSYITYRNHHIQVDTGGSHFDNSPASKMTSDLIYKRGQTIDLLILSHMDIDHVGGTSTLLERGLIRQIATGYEDIDHPVSVEITKSGVPTHLLRESDNINTGKLKIQFLNTDTHETAKDNDRSAVVLLDYDGVTALYTGDISAPIETGILDQLPPIDILKVAHHGSKYSTSQELVEYIRPNYSIISVGKNTYGHPTPEVLNNLENVGSKIYRTDLDGEIRFKMRDDIQIITANSEIDKYVDPTLYLLIIIFAHIMYLMLERKDLGIQRI